MNKVKYLAHYCRPEKEERHIYGLAAVNKLDYIFKVLSELGVETTVISACGSRTKKAFPKKTEEIYPNIILKLISTIKCKSKLSIIISELWFRLRLLLTLLHEVKNGDTLIVYHSLMLDRIVGIVKKLRKIKLVLEVEEIYGDAYKNKKITKRELRYFKNADGYIFATELLDKKVNVNKKPSVMIYGTYSAEKDYDVRFDDDKIHCVYAGTLDPVKKGAYIAVSVAEFLDDKYHIHILGFGDSEKKNRLLEEIEQISSKSSCTVTYDGCLSGNAYKNFLQKCHIGLSTQDPSAEFNDTSFPSKILSYMTNGLKVVCTRIPAVEISDIGSNMYYYDNSSPEDIAAAILNVNLNDSINGREIVNRLDVKFKTDILSMIEKLKS